MSRQLWRPVTEADGVSIEVLTIFTDALTAWKDEYLNAVGVPKNFEGEWDFVSVEYFPPLPALITVVLLFLRINMSALLSFILGRVILCERRHISHHVDYLV